MEDLLNTLIEPLVSDIKKIAIKRQEQEGGIKFTVNVPKEDIAKVIGKEGKMVKAIKNLLKIRAVKENKFVTLEIEEA
ncbi:MAG: hypothetical protein UT92_C0014G0007 [Candidatus Curtissbacteria bacterium GW2011_GWA1_40_24]|uniref:RNA-binding protein KhpA n=1 Tax=Candidatus Curtissbacteria bacterium GW2011_GWA1_40_24 TaxID=1618406 RepID=A0A0G0RXP1_9BACT|nr:MAG: hypothetical protein UT92_C0014G0007 [Candidatus Curtissbacteria bacterium GW2011_GWA1_40_24]